MIGLTVPACLPAQPQFSRKYATPPDGIWHFLETAPEHQQILVRAVSPWAGPGEFTLLRLDSLGDPVSNHRVGLTDSRAFLSPWDVYLDPVTGDQVIAGSAQSDVILGDSSAAMAIKLDSLSQLLWANAIHADSATVRFSKIEDFTPATYLAVGGVLDESSALTDENFFIAKLHRATGLMTAAVAFGGPVGELAGHIIYLPQHQQVIVAGETQSFGTQHHGVYIMALDTGLNKLWSRVIDGPSTDDVTGLMWVNGELLISGSTQGWPASGKEIFLARMSLGGTLLDYRTIELSGQYIAPYTASLMPGGNLVVGGWGWSPLGNFLMETDLLGQVQWAYTYPLGEYGLQANVHPDDKRIFMAEEVPDGLTNVKTVVWALGSDGVYGNGACNTPLTGWVTTVRQPTVITPVADLMPVLATDKPFTPWIQPEAMSWEPYCAAALGAPEAAPAGLTLSPNPAGDQVRLLWNAPLTGPVEVRLIDALGRVVCHLAVAEGSTNRQLDLASLPAGTYMVVVEGADGRHAFRLMH